MSDQTNAPKWQRGLVEVTRLTEGQVGVGTRHRFVRRLAGVRIAADNEYTAYDPDRRRVAFRVASGPAPGEGSYDVESTGPDSSRLTSRVEIDPSGLGRLAEPIIARSLRRQVEANLDTLKQLLEDDGPR